MSDEVSDVKSDVKKKDITERRDDYMEAAKAKVYVVSELTSKVFWFFAKLSGVIAGALLAITFCIWVKSSSDESLAQLDLKKAQTKTECVAAQSQVNDMTVRIQEAQASIERLEKEKAELLAKKPVVINCASVYEWARRQGRTTISYNEFCN